VYTYVLKCDLYALAKRSVKVFFCEAAWACPLKNAGRVIQKKV